MSPDPAQRLSAADAVFKSRDQSAAGAVDAALAKETDPGIKSALESAKAAIVLTSANADAAARKAAIDLIAPAATRTPSRSCKRRPPRCPRPTRPISTPRLTSIKDRLAIAEVFQNVWYGISLGSVLLLAAIGLAITFGVMGIINMAHGEMVMIGAYTTFVVQQIAQAYAPG